VKLVAEFTHERRQAHLRRSLRASAAELLRCRAQVDAEWQQVQVELRAEAPLRRRLRRAQQELDNAGRFTKKEPLKASVRDAEGRVQVHADQLRAAEARLLAEEERAWAAEEARTA